MSAIMPCPSCGIPFTFEQIGPHRERCEKEADLLSRRLDELTERVKSLEANETKLRVAHLNLERRVNTTPAPSAPSGEEHSWRDLPNNKGWSDWEPCDGKPHDGTKDWRHRDTPPATAREEQCDKCGTVHGEYFNRYCTVPAKAESGKDERRWTLHVDGDFTHRASCECKGELVEVVPLAALREAETDLIRHNNALDNLARKLSTAEAERDELQKYADHFVNTCQIDHRQVAYTNADSEEWQECPVCEWKKKADEARAKSEKYFGLWKDVRDQRDEARNFVVGLITQRDEARATVERVRALTSIRWHGNTIDVPTILAALASEPKK